MESLGVDCIDLAARRDAMERAFQSLYGVQASVAVRAPGRVDLMGSHTDYNDGFVLTLPIDRETWILARPRSDGLIHVASLNLGPRVAFRADSVETPRLEGWGLYVQGVAVELQRAGYPLTGFDGLVHGTVPLASGLSSSASLEAACATLFEALAGFTLDKVAKAKLTQRAENRWVGVNCGILDQYSSILGEQGNALLLDCRTLTHSYAELPGDLRVVICNTCAPRELSGSEYGERREQCEQGTAFFATKDPDVRAMRDVSLALFESYEPELPSQVASRCRFIMEENARVHALADALRRNDRSKIAAVTAASFAGARDLFGISVPAMQAMFDAMRAAPGCIGCRQAGAGFGGCMVAFVEEDRIAAFVEATTAAYRTATGLEPEVYPIRTAPGAGLLTKGAQ